MVRPKPSANCGGASQFNYTTTVLMSIRENRPLMSRRATSASQKTKKVFVLEGWSRTLVLDYQGRLAGQFGVPIFKFSPSRLFYFTISLLK